MRVCVFLIISLNALYLFPSDPDNSCYVNNCDRTYCSGNSCIKCEGGYFLSGTNCYKCPSNCLKCTDTYNCTECVRGTHGRTCISTCKSTCIDCTSSSQCGECIPGRYGSACELTCPLSCKGIVCDKISGKCTAGCKEGYYSSGEECNDCPDQCARCSNNSYCNSCVPGYHGAVCQKTCPVGCRNQLCDVVTGNCTDGCATGYHFNLGFCVKGMLAKINADCVHISLFKEVRLHADVSERLFKAFVNTKASYVS